MKIALAQINPTVGDLAGNRRLAEEAAQKAAAAGADLVVLPELALTGYPPMDLLERDRFVDDQLAELDLLAKASRGITIVVGAVVRTPDARPKAFENAAVVLADGRRLAHRAKTLLPTYDVFDEQRYFANAKDRTPVDVPGLPLSLGLAVCEDTWFHTQPYPVDPVAELVARGADVILNPSASPWHVGKAAERRALLADVAKGCGRPVVFVNQVGGNDELVFDGGSCVIGADGTVHAAMPLFETGLAICELPTRTGAGGGASGRAELALGPGRALSSIEDPSAVEQLERGLVLGIRDYFLKQNLPPGAVIGLSGGIDSAVTAHLAVEALGADRVVGIAMPGPFSTGHSIEDAFALGRLLGIDVRRADISPIYDVYRELFAKLFGRRDDYGLTQQNIQSRIRGAILMACSNEENRLVLATGNKSELSVGYCTLYGDTVGGLAVLGDVYKRDVYALARHANRNGERIPLRTIEKAPSAELASDQFDQNDLPPYDVLDDVLSQAIEGGRSRASIVPPPGCTDEVAQGIVRRLDRNEYKRRQTPLVLRTSEKAFGGGRRLPIVHRYTG